MPTNNPTLHTEAADRLMKVAEVAQRMSLSVRTIWKLHSRGDLPSVRIGGATRFRLSDVEEVIRNGLPASRSR